MKQVIAIIDAKRVVLMHPNNDTEEQSDIQDSRSIYQHTFTASLPIKVGFEHNVKREDQLEETDVHSLLQIS